MADESFDPFVTPVDYVVLNGLRSPGIAKVTGATDKRKWDVQIGVYGSGAITIYRGREISRFTVNITLVSADDWLGWAKWRKLVARPPNGTFIRTAMTIEHPWLRMLGIREVNVEEVGQPEENEETGAWNIAIKFLEFRLPTPSFAKPEGAKVKETDDPESRRIAALLVENITKSARRDQLQSEAK
jgi:hypothetical protein